MARANEETAALLLEYAELLLITGGDAFRARVYTRAARAVGGYRADVSDLDTAALRRIPGVGASIAEKIGECLATGTFRALEDLRARIPPGVREMTRIPALGPKRAVQLYRELGVGSVDQLAAAIREGKLRDLKGLGARSEEKLLRGIDLLREARQRVLLNVAMDTATDLVSALGSVPGCVAAVTRGRCGGCARRSATSTSSPRRTTQSH